MILYTNNKKEAKKFKSQDVADTYKNLLNNKYNKNYCVVS